MPPAARIGDQTAHGTPLAPGPGSATVLIGGQPAWRATADTHICPLLTSGALPHGSGVVMRGSATVFINGMPAARASDQIIEAGGTVNTIVTGDPTVLIGG